MLNREMKRFKYANLENDEEYLELKQALNGSRGTYQRRIKGILLSVDGYVIDEIADILGVNRDSVSAWIDSFEKEGKEGLKLKAGRGRKAILNEKERELAVELVKKYPTNIKPALEEIKERTGKKLSLWTLKNVIKKARLRWKRIRKTTKLQADSKKVEQAKKDLKALEALEKEGRIKIIYFDETGFSLTPCVPYAWQPSGRNGTLKIPSSKSNRINVLGFMSKKNDLEPYVFENTVDSAVVIACFDKFSEQIYKNKAAEQSKQTSADYVTIIDNASTHTSVAFSENIEKWQQRGLYLYFLPPYSPHLNKIETLWRKMKYEWMPFSAYQNMDTLRNALDAILINFNSSYQIIFS
jgi:transposase